MLLFLFNTHFFEDSSNQAYSKSVKKKQAITLDKIDFMSDYRHKKQEGWWWPRTINFRIPKKVHQKFAVIDERIVWYGSINILSFGASRESMMQFVSGSIARILEKSDELSNDY